MTTRPFVRTFTLLLALLIGAGTARADVPFDLLAATPPGSWQRQESVTTDSAGDRILTVIETALLQEAQHRGIPHVWVQTEVNTFQLGAAGQREPVGERTVVQALVERRVLAAGAFGGMDNLRRFGKEIIYQVGAQQATRVSGAGQLAATLAAMTGANTTPVLTPLGAETLATSAGRFETHRLGSQFRSSGQMLGQTVSIDVQGTVWLSPAVPFGFVRSDSIESINGVASSTRAELVAYGRSGASSKITGSTRDFEIPPELRGVLGSLQGLLGGGN
jgi:hypothetical protein